MFEADSAPQESGAIRKVLGSLDAATKEFTQRLEELAALGSAPRRNGPGRAGLEPKLAAAPVTEAAPVEAPAPPRPTPMPARKQAHRPPPPAVARTQLDLDRRMAEADAEAKRYLDQAKQRADAMVQSIVGAVEVEAETMRRDAEQQIRARWRQVEIDAERFLDDARRVADGLVADRQRRISELSDTIVGLAETLSGRMHDADQVRRQFDSLVVTLSETSGRLAAAPAAVSEPAAAPMAATEAATPAEETPLAEPEPAPAARDRRRAGHHLGRALRADLARQVQALLRLVRASPRDRRHRRGARRAR